MKKVEFEKKIKELKLEKVYREGKIQVYSNEQNDYYRDKIKDNIYGCCLRSNTKDYVIFFTDVERGIVVDLGIFKTEEEAYEELFKIVQEWEASNKKK